MRLFVATGVFCSVVVTPVILKQFGLDIQTWQTIVCCSVSVLCYKGVKWVEGLIIQRLGLDRRNICDNDEDDQRGGE